MSKKYRYKQAIQFRFEEGSIVHATGCYMKNVLLQVIALLIWIDFSFAQSKPADSRATVETVNLYHSLARLLNKGTMIGHQDDLAYGVGWKYVEGRSDIKDVTGDYPAVYGWELGRIELDHQVNLDSVPFEKIAHFIRLIYDRGGIVTISWHLNNPLTGKTAWDPAPGSVASVLPGGAKNELFKSWLDRVASFFLSLKGNHGELIPVIFRPFHELNGSWFWWGGKNCTPEETRELYQFTVKYLRDVKQVHNLLYAYNTDKFYSRAEYMERYPGNDFVDVIGFDIYQAYNTASNDNFVRQAGLMLSMLDSVASENHKIPALTEFGYAGLPDPEWWTQVFWKAIAPYRIAYALAWRNAGGKGNGSSEFYVPFDRQISAGDFVRFYNEKRTLFQREITKEQVYH